MFFLGSLYLERVLGYDALQIGLAFLPVTLVMGTLSVRYTEPLVMRFGARKTILPGMALIALGLLLFTQAPVDGTYVRDVLPLDAPVRRRRRPRLPGADDGGDVGRDDAGLASGLVNTSAQVGGALGLAVLATLSSTRSSDLINAGQDNASALTSGYHFAFLVGSGLVVGAIVVALTVLKPDQPQEQEAMEAEQQGEQACAEAA